MKKDKKIALNSVLLTFLFFLFGSIINHKTIGHFANLWILRKSTNLNAKYTNIELDQIWLLTLICIDAYLKTTESAFNTVLALIGSFGLALVLLAGPHNRPVINLQFQWFLLHWLLLQQHHLRGQWGEWRWIATTHRRRTGQQTIARLLLMQHSGQNRFVEVHG